MDVGASRGAVESREPGFLRDSPLLVAARPPRRSAVQSAQSPRVGAAAAALRNARADVLRPRSGGGFSRRLPRQRLALRARRSARVALEMRQTVV
jgi:hypothetical protein